MKHQIFNSLLILNLILILGIISYLYQNNKIELDLSKEILKVRGLVVTDSLGVERVIIGAPLPPPQMHGYRFYRGDNSDVSGVMLYDSEGQERGGYVTDNAHGNVFLTLDSKTSQRVLFIAEPQGAAVLRMWARNGNKIEIGVEDEGAWITGNNSGEKISLFKE